MCAYLFGCAGNVGDDLDICINQATTVRVVKSIGFDYKEHNAFRTLNLEEVAGLQDRQYVSGSILERKQGPTCMPGMNLPYSILGMSG